MSRRVRQTGTRLGDVNVWWNLGQTTTITQDEHYTRLLFPYLRSTNGVYSIIWHAGNHALRTRIRLDRQ